MMRQGPRHEPLARPVPRQTRAIIGHNRRKTRASDGPETICQTFVR